MGFDISRAQEAVENGIAQAQELINDPSKIDDLLAGLEEKLKDVPLAGTMLADIPLMISMVRSYITKEYTQVSLKVIATMVSAFIYIVKKKDLIPDSIAVVGAIDDIAVFAIALKFVEPELKAYAEFRGSKLEAAEAASEWLEEQGTE